MTLEMQELCFMRIEQVFTWVVLATEVPHLEVIRGKVEF